MTQIKTKTLNDVCELIVDCEHKTALTQATGYPSIRTPNIGRGRLILDNVNRVSEETYKAWTKRAIPQADDLILAREAPVGNVAIIPKNLKVCLGQRTVLIRPNKNKVEPNYLVYLLLGDKIQGKILSVSNGATVHHLNMKDIRNLELPELPSLPIQRKIAAILSAYDRLIENNTRRIEILEEMARSIYREWFVKFRFPGHEQVQMVDSELGLIPEGWKAVKVEDVVELAYGKSLTAKNRIPGTVPVYGSAGVVGYHNESLVNAPGVVVGRKGNVGSVFWSNDDFFPIDTVFYVQTKVCLHYVYYNLQNQNFINNDAAVPGLNRNQAYSLPFLLPSENLLKQFQHFVDVIFKQTSKLRIKNDNLRQTRDLLLPRLISGEIDVENLDINTGEIAA
jgi:type I restriction enzyme S subunit